jgi:tetratricopeptide (TPR) repeat protein
MKIIGLLVFFMSVFTTVFPTVALAGPNQQAFEQMVSSFRQNPGDDGLREKIIRSALKLTPKPAVPKEAKSFMLRGEAAVETAKTPDDFVVAAAEFQKAVNVAPWFADAYYNLGMVQEKAKQFGQAVKSLRWYLLAAPKASDAEKVENLITKLEFWEEQASSKKSQQAMIQGLSGEWHDPRNLYGSTVTVAGNEITVVNNKVNNNGRWQPMGGSTSSLRGTIDGLKITGTWSMDWSILFNNGSFVTRPMTGTISPDGNRIHFDYIAVGPNGAVGRQANGWLENRVQYDIVR